MSLECLQEKMLLSIYWTIKRVFCSYQKEIEAYLYSCTWNSNCDSLCQNLPLLCSVISTSFEYNHLCWKRPSRSSSTSISLTYWVPLLNHTWPPSPWINSSWYPILTPHGAMWGCYLICWFLDSGVYLLIVLVLGELGRSDSASFSLKSLLVLIYRQVLLHRYLIYSVGKLQFSISLCNYLISSC